MHAQSLSHPAQSTLAKAGRFVFRAVLTLSALFLLVASHFSAATVAIPTPRTMAGAQLAGVAALAGLTLVAVALLSLGKLAGLGREVPRLLRLFALLTFSGMPLLFVGVIVTNTLGAANVAAFVSTGNLLGLLCWLRLTAVISRS